MPDGLRALGRAGRLARATRAYLAGIGTSGSLLAGAALMFIVASALVAYRGWPHVAAQPSPGEVVVSPRSAPAATSPLGRRLAFVAGTAGPGGLAGAGGRGGGVGGAGGAVGAGTHRSVGAPASTSRPTGTSSAPGGGGALGTPGCASCGSGPAPSSPVPVAAPPPQQVVHNVTGALGTVVSGAGGKLSSGVKHTTSAVGGAVGAINPSVGGGVSATGSGAATAVGGVTRTIAGELSGVAGH